MNGDPFSFDLSEENVNTSTPQNITFSNGVIQINKVSVAYNEGLGEEDWNVSGIVNGYGGSTDHSKMTDHLYLQASGGGDPGGYGTIGFYYGLTNLENFSKVVCEWSCDDLGSTPVSVGVGVDDGATNPARGNGTKTTTRESGFSRQTNSLDISDVSGSGNVSVGIYAEGGAEAELRTYHVGLHR